MTLKWLPNALTISRCLLAGVVLWSAWKAHIQFSAPVATEDWSDRATLEQLWAQLGILAFMAGALTDFGDGVLARALNAHSRFGVWLDPIADKLLVGAALAGLCLTIGGWVIILPASAIILRDVAMTAFRTTTRGRGAVVVSSLAKWKTAVEMIAIAALMIPAALAPRPEPEPNADTALSVFDLAAGGFVALLWVAAILSVWTGLQYVRAAYTSEP